MGAGTAQWAGQCGCGNGGSWAGLTLLPPGLRAGGADSPSDMSAGGVGTTNRATYKEWVGGCFSVSHSHEKHQPAMKGKPWEDETIGEEGLVSQNPSTKCFMG